jgi:hypothetical protein
MSSPDNFFNFGAFWNGVNMEIFILSTRLRDAVIQINSPNLRFNCQLNFGEKCTLLPILD